MNTVDSNIDKKKSFESSNLSKSFSGLNQSIFDENKRE